jgi:hypothetical protein
MAHILTTGISLYYCPFHIEISLNLLQNCRKFQPEFGRGAMQNFKMGEGISKSDKNSDSRTEISLAQVKWGYINFA